MESRIIIDEPRLAARAKPTYKQAPTISKGIPFILSCGIDYELIHKKLLACTCTLLSRPSSDYDGDSPDEDGIRRAWYKGLPMWSAWVQHPR